MKFVEVNIFLLIEPNATTATAIGRTARGLERRRAPIIRAATRSVDAEDNAIKVPPSKLQRNNHLEYQENLKKKTATAA